MNLTKAPKKTNDASIDSNEIDQSELFSDKILEKAKFNGLKTNILKSITNNTSNYKRNKNKSCLSSIHFIMHV